MSLERESESSGASSELVIRAEELKSNGNKAMKSADLEEALRLYSQGIEMISGCHETCPTLSSQLYSNRAAVELVQKSYEAACSDCARALEFDSSNLKAYWRGAKANLQLNRLNEAASFCEKGLTVDSKNTDLHDLKSIIDRRNNSRKGNRGFTQDEAVSCQNLVNQLKEQMFLINQKIQAHELEAARNSRTITLVNQTPDSAPVFSAVGRGFIRVPRDSVFKGLGDRVSDIRNTDLPECMAAREAISKRLTDAETELNEMIEYFKQRSTE